MHHLLYASAGVRRFAGAEIEDILETSRRNNAVTGITGMLLYADGNFIQYIEGEAEALDALFARISADRRHRRPMVLSRGPIEARGFSDWSMGYKPLDAADRRPLARFDLSRAALDARLDAALPKVVLAMMRQFYATNHARAVD